MGYDETRPHRQRPPRPHGHFFDALLKVGRPNGGHEAVAPRHARDVNGHVPQRGDDAFAVGSEEVGSRDVRHDPGGEGVAQEGLVAQAHEQGED